MTYNIHFFMWRKCVANIKLQTTMLSMEKLNKGGNFLKKLWCCVGRRV